MLNYTYKPRAKSNPALIKRTGLQVFILNNRAGRVTSSPAHLKLFKSMKTISFLILSVFVLSNFNAVAQIKVYEDNRIKIFGDRPTDDVNKDLTLQIYGKYGEYLANGRIGFGSYGINEMTLHRKRVFVGELGTNIDSDKLELCGSQGLYLTWGQGYSYNHVIGKMDMGMVTEPQKFYFNTYVYAKGVKLNSDERFKENISPLNYPLDKLKLLNGVCYNLKWEIVNSVKLPENVQTLSEKEQSDWVILAQAKQKLENSKKQNIGFIAQQLQEVFPDLVDEDSDGYLHIDYIGLIPILVESIKEQQTKIAMLKSVLSVN